MPYTEDASLIRWLGKQFMLGREAVSDFVADFLWDQSDSALKVRKVFITDVGDPPDSVMRRIGPDNADALTPRQDFRRVKPNYNIGTWAWMAFCGWDDTGPGDGFTGKNAQIYARTRGAQTPASSGGSLHLGTCPEGAIEPVDRIELEADGTLSLSGVPTTYADGAAWIRVRSADGQIRRLKLE